MPRAAFNSASAPVTPRLAALAAMYIPNLAESLSRRSSAASPSWPFLRRPLVNVFNHHRRPVLGLRLAVFRRQLVQVLSSSGILVEVVDGLSDLRQLQGDPYRVFHGSLQNKKSPALPFGVARDTWVTLR